MKDHAKIQQYILSRLLPKTGQETSYYDDDDGLLELGWWENFLLANNKDRFLARTLEGDDVVIDLATGLMWAADGDEAGCRSATKCSWSVALNYAKSLDFAGFTDWRIPNIFELISIVDSGSEQPLILEPPFANTRFDSYWWTSTSRHGLTTFAATVGFSMWYVSLRSKITNYYLRCVRSL